MCPFAPSGVGLPASQERPSNVCLQVWNLVAGDNSSLTKPQFYSTLRLISLAQATLPTGHRVASTALLHATCSVIAAGSQDSHVVRARAEERRRAARGAGAFPAGGHWARAASAHHGRCIARTLPQLLFS